MTSLLRRVAALVLLLGITIGAPQALLTFGGSLIPDHAPGLGQMWMALTTPDSGRVLAAAMLLVGLVAWAVFTICVLLEIVSRISRRPAWHLPGLGLPQAVAASLIGLILAGTISIAGAPAAAASRLLPLPQGSVTIGAVALPDQIVTASRVAAAAVSVPATALRSWAVPAAGPTWTVRKGDTLWAIADTTLGNPLRFQEILTLNAGHVQADGKRLTSGDWLEQGWVLMLPADAQLDVGAASGSGSAVDVVVSSGDTVSQIAAEHGSDTSSVWAANAGRAEPDGWTFTDPDAILPGWTLSVPTADAPGIVPADIPAGVAVAVVIPAEQGAVTPPGADPGVVTPPVAAAEPAGGTPGAGIDPPAGQVTQPAPQPGVTGSAEAPRTPQGPPATVADTSKGESSSMSTARIVELGAAGAGLLAGAAYGALMALRRRQFRHRRPGRTIMATPAELVAMERVLVTAGRTGFVDVKFVDEALRALVLVTAAMGLELPDVVAARLSAIELELVLDLPCWRAPTPWVSMADGNRWVLTRTDHAGLTDTARQERVAPYPALVSVGHTADGDHWLLDLERMGAVRVSGDRIRCQDLARFMAAELAHNVWSEMLQITLVGFGDQMSELNPSRLLVTADLDRALTVARAHRREVKESDVGVLRGRLDDITTDAWAPHVLIIDPSAATDSGDMGALLNELGADRERSTVAVVVTTGTASAGAPGWDLIVDDTGVLRIPGLGVELVAEQLPAGEAAQLSRLLRFAADTRDQAPPARVGERAWEAQCDALGALLPTDGVRYGRDEQVLRLAGPQPAGSSVLPMPALAYAASAATTADDLTALAPTVTDEVRLRVESADTRLDEDLLQWHLPESRVPKVTLLGPVDVRAQGMLPVERPQRPWNVELVAYLATRTHGATVEQYASDMWPDDPDIIDGDGRPKPKVRTKMSTARRWLGLNERTGRDHIPTNAGVKGAIYRVEDALVDAELFRRLRLRGMARGAAGIADLQQALNLVSGVPFDQLRPAGYGWLALDPLNHQYTAMIVDVAHVVATHHLQSGAPGLAGEASQVALRAGSFDDITRLDLIAACRAVNDADGADRYLREIMLTHGAEVEEDLPVRTLAILDGRQWLPRSG